jgi:hypothetical protein
MQVETAKALVEALANCLNIAIDNRNKIAALELAIQKYEPNLFQAYVKILEEVRQNPPTSISLAGFANLQEKLVQS